ncbi:acylphosphatase, partial [Streptomyces sp. GC420]|uniref:acylphosphatase n=1 Tax=Streptomyces sp. GC420 TaxID=2697568 RepID=UPI001414CFEA
MTAARAGQHIEVYGTVQGVGFRPYVHRVATRLELDGWVRNSDGHVELTVAGHPAALRELTGRLRHGAPPLAAVRRVRVRPLPDTGLPSPGSGFAVHHSAPVTGSPAAARAAPAPAHREIPP